MEVQELLTHVDHTLLKTTCTWEQIKEVCDDAIKYHVASICIPPSFIKQAKEYVKDKTKVGAPIGFPNGYHTTAVKVFETEDAMKNGADEIDMVINLGWVKDEKWDEIEDEIRKVKNACGGHVLKVIIETCELTNEEKIRLCKVVTDVGADFIKTSTGFSTGGATLSDVKLLKENVGGDVKVKASGGISSIEDAKAFVDAGASRLGTSKVVAQIKNERRD